MFSSPSARSCVASIIGTGILLSAGLIRVTYAQNPSQTETKERPIGSLIVDVKESETGEPISQARLTLQFQEPGDPSRVKLPKKFTYSAKTNAQGRYKFTNINKGTIHLYVTMERHQSFGKEFEFDKDDQVFEVKLKKPQPLL
jgi:hypothetical protein